MPHNGSQRLCFIKTLSMMQIHIQGTT